MKAHELLKEPGSWIQHAGAKDKNGYCVKSRDPSAVSWCLMGALVKCHGGKEYIMVADAVEILLGGRGMSEWNDDPFRTHKEVLEVLKKLDI